MCAIRYDDTVSYSVCLPRMRRILCLNGTSLSLLLRIILIRQCYLKSCRYTGYCQSIKHYVIYSILNRSRTLAGLVGPNILILLTRTLQRLVQCALSLPFCKASFLFSSTVHGQKSILSISSSRTKEAEDDKFSLNLQQLKNKKLHDIVAFLLIKKLNFSQTNNIVLKFCGHCLISVA